MIVIHGELYSSKNSKQIKYVWRKKHQRKPGGSPVRPIITDSDVVERASVSILEQLERWRFMWERMKQGKTYPLRVELSIYRKTAARFDYNNISHSLFDLMTKAGYWPDDSADYVIPVFQPYEVDKDNPRVELRIL